MTNGKLLKRAENYIIIGWK